MKALSYCILVVAILMPKFNPHSFNFVRLFKLRQQEEFDAYIAVDILDNFDRQNIWFILYPHGTSYEHIRNINPIKFKAIDNDVSDKFLDKTGQILDEFLHCAGGIGAYNCKMSYQNLFMEYFEDRLSLRLKRHHELDDKYRQSNSGQESSQFSVSKLDIHKVLFKRPDSVTNFLEDKTRILRNIRNFQSPEYSTRSTFPWRVSIIYLWLRLLYILYCDIGDTVDLILGISRNAKANTGT